MTEINVNSIAPIKNMRNKYKSCYGCIYYSWSNNYCNWFTVTGHGRSRKIPVEIRKVGCKYHEGTIKEYDDPTGIIKKIIETFDGELL